MPTTFGLNYRPWAKLHWAYTDLESKIECYSSASNTAAVKVIIYTGKVACIWCLSLLWLKACNDKDASVQFHMHKDRPSICLYMPWTFNATIYWAKWQSETETNDKMTNGTSDTHDNKKQHPAMQWHFVYASLLPTLNLAHFEPWGSKWSAYKWLPTVNLAHFQLWGSKLSAYKWLSTLNLAHCESWGLTLCAEGAPWKHSETNEVLQMSSVTIWQRLEQTMRGQRDTEPLCFLHCTVLVSHEWHEQGPLSSFVKFRAKV